MPRISLFLFGLALLGADAPKADPAVKPDADALARGQAVYMRTCIACHQPNGKGIPAVFPPLDGSDWLESDTTLLSKIVLRGLQGPVTVNGTTYNSVMAPLADVLKDPEIADVLNYVRTTYGKGGPLVTPEIVKEARAATANQKQPWTAAELGRK